MSNKTPQNFLKGEKIKISCRLNTNKNFQGYLHYREVNHSKNWKKKKLKNTFGIFSSIISDNFTNTSYSIQYYYEFELKKHSYFSPGFNKFLSNQPYYLLRQKK